MQMISQDAITRHRHRRPKQDGWGKQALVAALMALLGLLPGLGKAEPPAGAGTQDEAEDRAEDRAENETASLRLLALGDSLTSGWGLPPNQGLTVALEQALRRDGYRVTVINAGVAGDTSAGGLARLDWLLSDRPDAALVALGANDGLRGLDPAKTKDNLARILEGLQAQDIPTLLAGMKAPRNLGDAYAAAFDPLYAALAARYDVVFYPFLLEGVATAPDLNQGDGIHPNAKGVAVIVEGLLPAVKTLLDESLPARKPEATGTRGRQRGETAAPRHQHDTKG